MRVKNPKFLNTIPQVFGIRTTELFICVASFYLGNLVIQNELITFGLVCVQLLIMMKLRDYPSFHFIHFLLRDDLIKTQGRVEEVDCE